MAVQTVGSYGARLNLNIKQGATFSFRVTIENPDETPVDLTGSIVRAQIRKNALDATIVASFVVDIFDAVNGVADLSLTDEVTALIPCSEDGPTSEDSIYKWDAELEDTLGRVTPLFYGVAALQCEVTRAP